MKNQLETMLKMQDILHQKVSPKLTYEYTKNLTVDELMYWMRRVGEVSIAENVEVQQECGMKWWKEDTLTPANLPTKLEKIKEEVVDVVHFALAYCVILGMDHNELFERYSNKNTKNHVRPDWDCNSGDKGGS